MSQTVEVRIPDIGDYKDVPVIEVMVAVGDTVRAEDPLLTLESDKATMEVPAPAAGVVRELKLQVGDKVSRGSLVLLLEPATAAAAAPAAPETPVVSSAQAPVAPAAPAATSVVPAARGDLHAEVLVLGSGPGGYTAAFRAADLGRQVVMVERHATLGGVCLNVGCIPSKALLHAARVVAEAEEMSHFGVSFGKPAVDLGRLRDWKSGVVGRLTKGLAGLARQRKVEVVTGQGRFLSDHLLEVQGPEGARRTVSFDHCIIAAGSRSARIPGFPYDDPRLMDSTSALALADVPQRLLVIGGGIIGLEMACVYDALGSRVTVVELADGLIPGADRDLVKPLHKRLEKRYEAILLRTRVTALESTPAGLVARFEGEGAPEPQTYDRVLLAVGRRPNGLDIGADKAGVTVDARGFIPVDRQQRSSVPHIYAIGDICGEPMLAHKATHEGKLAAEVLSGHRASFDARTIPSVAYTDPEVAWMGLTETAARAQGIAYEKASFPWAASGRALATGRDEGMTKLLFHKDTRRLLGAGMVGPNAGELIAETVLALEMGADASDIGLTIHPHPTLSETVFFAAEIAEGSITDLYMPRR